jgi:hypothetical protein
MTRSSVAPMRREILLALVILIAACQRTASLGVVAADCACGEVWWAALQGERSEAQDARNRVTAFGRASSDASTFRSVPDPQFEFGPTDLQQVRIRSRVAFRPCEYNAREIKRSLDCPLAFSLSL